MLEKIKNFFIKIDRFFYKKFGSHKTTKILENIKEAQVIFSYIDEIGEENKIKFVGGCVRKALLGENIDDIDLATSLQPSEIKKKLENKNIQIIDTGIDHGTLTIVLNKKKFEITTLREDTSTDGRHANVKFTIDWTKDASRRDFTINAVYADINGRIFDPLNGIQDLENGKIKFIGFPEERIQEDYIRILRYFRFFIQYSKLEHDPKVIKSIKRYINGLNKISNERIFDELKKILKLKNIYNLFLNKLSKEIILNIFPQFIYHERLKIIDKLSIRARGKYDSYLLLGLLIIDQSNNYEYFCHKYKTSNSIKKRFKNISENIEKLTSKKFYLKENIKRLIYTFDKDTVKDLLLFSVCVNKKIKTEIIEELIEYVNLCKIPKFPISGDDLKKHGYKTGKSLGLKLKLLEEEWIRNNFTIKKKKLDKSLSKINEN